MLHDLLLLTMAIHEKNHLVDTLLKNPVGGKVGFPGRVTVSSSDGQTPLTLFPNWLSYYNMMGSHANIWSVLWKLTHNVD